MPKKSDIVLLAAAAVFIAMMLVSIFAAVLPEYWLNFTVSLGGALLALIFVVPALFCLSFDRDFGRAWRLLGVGILLWAAAEFVWFFYPAVLLKEVPSVSVADLFWILGYVPLVFGLCALGKSIFPAVADRKFVVIPLVFVFSAAIIFLDLWPLVVDPTIGLVEKAVGIFYPIGDIVLFLIAVDALVAIRGGKLTRPWLMLALSFIVFATSDALYTSQVFAGTYVVGGITDMLYYFAYFLAAFAASEMLRLKEDIIGRVPYKRFMQPSEQPVEKPKKRPRSRRH